MVFRLIGHRGARGEAPENTLAGFSYAASLGLSSVEFDVRRTRDDQVVVIHDATVDRTTNGTGTVAEMTLGELTALDARSVDADWSEPCAIPTFDQVLPIVEVFDHIQIEIKSESSARMELTITDVLARLQQLGIGHKSTMSSFDAAALAIVQRLAPEQRRAYIGSFTSQEDFEMARRLGCSQIDISLQKGVAEAVAEAHARGWSAIGFQCNSAQDLAIARAWGIDGATSDYPSTILPLLQNDPERTSSESDAV
ncbi:MAG: glycerophosphodiester phosphodiesterase [Thermomicrobiales bacterium]